MSEANLGSVVRCRARSRAGARWMSRHLGGLVTLLGLMAAPLPLLGEAPATQPTVESEGEEAQEAPAESPSAPDGFVEMTVHAVAPTGMGNVVVLTDRLESVMVPIWIGDSEALAIALRLEGEAFRRPLTHDLVDAVLRELGGQLVQVRIDSLDANTFVASLFIRHGERDILLDSRASDSIALALGNGVPIFVSRAVIDEAGVRAGELELPQPEQPGDEPGDGPQIPL